MDENGCCTVIKQEFRSQYVYNKHNTSWKVRLYSISALVGLYQNFYSFDFWYFTNSCVNTVEPLKSTSLFLAEVLFNSTVI